MAVGELTYEDLDAICAAVMDASWKAKEKNRRNKASDV